MAITDIKQYAPPDPDIEQLGANSTQSGRHRRIPRRARRPLRTPDHSIAAWIGGRGSHRIVRQ